MKFQELKQKFKNRFTMRMLAGVLCVALLGTGLGMGCMDAGAAKTVQTAQAEDGQKDSELTGRLTSMIAGASDKEESLDGKEETVYLIAGADGTVQQTIVSSWLKNGSGQATVADVSTLSDIENVKGDETFSQNGDKVTWQADGNDIYYRGTTDKEAPLTEKITYYLDGVETSPQELAGKSGTVTIRFDYENHEKKTVTVNGKQQQIYVPFTVMSGLVFDDSFRNVRVNHGKVLSDGTKNAVVGFAMPGLKESLDVDESDFDEDFEFPDYVEVTADVEDFSLGMTATVAMPGLLSDTELAGGIDMSELDQTVDDLSDAMGQLKDGGGALADGLSELKQSMDEFQDGAGSLKDGVNAYTDGASKLAAGIQTLSDSTGTLADGAGTLNASAKTISDGLAKLDGTLNTKMGKKEQEAVAKQAGAAVDAQFAAGSKTYNQIYNAAVDNYEKTMTSDDTVKSVQAGIQAGMKAQGLTSDGVVAALAAYYAQNGFTDAEGKNYPAKVCQSAVPGTDTTYAAYFANAVLNGGLSQALAGGVTDGLASQGAAAVGSSVVSACQTAAKTAGEAAAVSGAEAAKKQVAAAIEAKDADSGYSLVSGAKALSAGTQTLADSVPTLQSGIAGLLNGAETLVANNAALKDGAGKLSDGTVQIRDGVGKLSDGADELSDGLEEFDKKAITKLVDAYNGDVKELTGRMDALVQAGKDYRSFAGAAQGVDSVTKFIIRTDAIKQEDR